MATSAGKSDDDILKRIKDKIDEFAVTSDDPKFKDIKRPSALSSRKNADAIARSILARESKEETLGFRPKSPRAGG